jgi:predicted alpha/beta hydrolase family esterase
MTANASATLDFVIRNQVCLFLGFGAIATVLYLIVKLGRPLSRGHWSKVWRTSPQFSLDFGMPGLSLSTPLTLHIPFPAFVIKSLFLLILFGILALTKPVPKTTALHLPAFLRDNRENTDLIIFIHGWTGDVTETWRDFPQLVMKDTRFDRCNVVSLSYPTYIAQRSLTVPQLSQWLSRKLRQEGYYDRHTRISIVAHSMGGLVAREIVIGNRLEGIPEKIQNLVEIATPHEGAGIAGLAGALGISRAYIKDVEPGAEYLGNLRDHWNALRPRPPTFAITSKADSVVTERSALSQCDRFLVFPQWGHTELAKPERKDDDRYSVSMDEVAAALK